MILLNQYTVSNRSQVCPRRTYVDEHMWIVTLNFGQITLTTSACLFILHGLNSMLTITSECSLIKMTNWLDCTLSGVVITWIVSLAYTQPLSATMLTPAKCRKLDSCIYDISELELSHEIDFEIFFLSYRTLYNSIASSRCSLDNVFISLKVIIYRFDKNFCLYS